MNAGGKITLHADQAQLSQFVSGLFRYADEGTFISLRAFDQIDRTKKPALIRAIPINGDLTKISDEAFQAENALANMDRPTVFAPPVCTFTNGIHASTNDLANGVALSVDIDEADTRAARIKLEHLLGQATVIVESGGEWTDPATGEIHPKLHIHWRLSEPTREDGEHAKLRQARDLAARLAGADPSSKTVVHPLRWPGTWNRKSKPRLARIVAFNDDAEINLDQALEALSEAVEAAGLASVGMPTSASPQAAHSLVASAMAAIPNPATTIPYDTWIRYGYAVHRAAGGQGFEIWEAWSAKSDKHIPSETEAAWTRIGKALAGKDPPRTIGAGTIFFDAKIAGWARPDPIQDEPPPEMDEGYYAGQEAEREAQTGKRSRRRQADNGSPVEWPEPLDFLADADMTGAPELRAEHIPEAIAPFVFDTAARLGVDPAAAALAALVSLASVMSDDWEIQPKQNDYTWTENPRIWGGIVGDPSMLKSPIVKVTTAPIDKMDADARKRHENDMQRWKREMKAWKDNGSDPESEPKQPRLDRYLVEGATTEAISEVLRDDFKATMRAPAGKVLIRQDEMSEWLASFDLYRNGGKGGADRGAYLRLYNGGRYTIDRVARGAFAMSNWSACVLGGIQPAVIRQIAKDAADDGLLQRFCYCVPAHQGRGEDRKPDAAGLARYAALFPAVVALKPGTNAFGKPERVVLHAEAHQHREDILDLIEALSAMPDTSNRMKSALGKWPGLWARMTLVFHLIGIADAKARGVPHDVVNVARGAAVMATNYLRDILLPHLLRADAVMFATEQTGHARWIAGFILSKGESRIAARDIMRVYRPFRAPEQRQEMLEVMASLEAMGWVRPEFQADGRAPVAWHVNPKVHTSFTERAKRERAEREATKERIRETLAKYMKSKEAA